MASAGKAYDALREPGDHPVDVPVTCVLTRFGVRSPRLLLPSYLDYREVLGQVVDSRTPGLLHSAFLLESPKAWFSLSIWADPDVIPHFGTNVPLHVAAARRMFGRLAFEHGRGPELWSTKWRLASVSNNLNWDEFSLRDHVRSAESDLATR